MSKKSNAPVLIELDEAPKDISPATAPVVPDMDVPNNQAMQILVRVAARKRSTLSRVFWAVVLALLGFVVTVAFWDFVTGMIARHQYLGYAAIGLTGLFVIVLLVMAMREWLGFWRLKRLDSLRKEVEKASNSNELPRSIEVTNKLVALYQVHAETEWGCANFIDQKADQLDAEGLLTLAETEIIGPLDALAIREIEAASRQVATVTAIVPLALADVVVALTANLRMIRRIAETYGGRSGAFGNWRLTRSVLAHLVATGAVAVGDDLIGTIAGGGIMSKISRRFGEGVINGALTARVGVAAMEVCRPMPFTAIKRPAVTGLVKRALAGLFGRG